MIELYESNRWIQISYNRGQKKTDFTPEEFRLAMIRDISHDVSFGTSFYALGQSNIAVQFKETYKLINYLLELNTILYALGEEIADQYYYKIKEKFYLYPDSILLKNLRENIQTIVNQIYKTIIKRTDKYTHLFALESEIYNYLRARFFSKKKRKIIKPYKKAYIYSLIANYAVAIAEEIYILIDKREIKSDLREYINLASIMNKTFLKIYWDLAVDLEEDVIRRAEIVRKEVNKDASALGMISFRYFRT